MQFEHRHVFAPFNLTSGPDPRVFSSTAGVRVLCAPLPGSRAVLQGAGAVLISLTHTVPVRNPNPNMLLLSWIAQGGGLGTVTLDLLNCSQQTTALTTRSCRITYPIGMYRLWYCPGSGRSSTTRPHQVLLQRSCFVLPSHPSFGSISRGSRVVPTLAANNYEPPELACSSSG